MSVKLESGKYKDRFEFEDDFRLVISNAKLLKAIAGTDWVDDRSYGAPIPEKIPAYHELLMKQTDA